MARTWRQRTPYINAYNELRERNLNDIKDLKQQVQRLEWMVEYMAAKMFPKKEEKQ